jgi:H+-transporting ATPase
MEEPTNDKPTIEVDGEKQDAPEDDNDGESIHFGDPLIASDQSAITGESLAVDKCKQRESYSIP